MWTGRESDVTTADVPYKRIATEEAWAPPSLLETYRTMAAKKSIDDPGFVALWNRLGSRGQLVERLGDIGERRIADMDASGIDMQILSLTSPGVQVFDAATATFARHRHQRPARRGDPAISDPLCRPRRRGAAGSEVRGQGDRSRRASAWSEGRDHQLAHAR